MTDNTRDWTAGVRPEVLDTIAPRRHDTDGQVYLGYYRNDAVLGFVWDGNIEHPVQVTREMGEPIIDTFEMPDLTFAKFPSILAAFKHACDVYTDNVED